MCCVLGELVGQPDIELLDFDGLECLQSASAEYRHGMAKKLRITFDGYSTGFLLAPAWRSHSEPLLGPLRDGDPVGFDMCARIAGVP